MQRIKRILRVTGLLIASVSISAGLVLATICTGFVWLVKAIYEGLERKHG